MARPLIYTYELKDTDRKPFPITVVIYATYFRVMKILTQFISRPITLLQYYQIVFRYKRCVLISYKRIVNTFVVVADNR